MWSQTRDNKIRYFERYLDPLTGKTKTVSCTLARPNAKKASAILHQKIESKSPVQTEALTLKDLVDRYAIYQSQTIKQSTCERNSYEAKAVLSMLGEGSLVDRLTVSYVTEKLLAAKETPTNTNARMKYLKALIRWAYRSDLISSPTLADKLKYLPDHRKKEKLSTKYMEPAQLRAVLDHMKEERWKLLTKFLCLSGLRIGELVALNDSDVGEKYIHIDKTFSYLTKQPGDTPKTDCSNREVFIQPELADCIKEIRTLRNQMLLRERKTSHLFFPDRNGGYVHYDAYRAYLKENTEKVIGIALTPHACRHTMTSIFAAQGADLDAISRRLGHSESDLTRDIYYHVTAEQKRKDEAKFAEIKML